MADAIFSNSNLSPTKQDLVAAIVQKELAFQAKLVRTVTDYSSFAVKGAKSIAIPRGGSFTAVDRASGVYGDATAFNFLTDQMPLDKCAFVSWIVDSCDEIESVLSLEAVAIQRAASAHSRFVDSALITELELVGVATTTAGNITQDIVLEMRQALIENEADPMALSLVIAPAQEAIMLKIADFIRADAYGSSAVPSGVLGKIYGTEVIVHNGLAAANQYFMYDKSGMAIGFQKSAEYGEQPEVSYGAKAKKAVLEQKFGVKGLQIAESGVPAGKSALVVKDNN